MYLCSGLVRGLTQVEISRSPLSIFFLVDFAAVLRFVTIMWANQKPASQSILICAIFTARVWLTRWYLRKHFILTPWYGHPIANRYVLLHFSGCRQTTNHGAPANNTTVGIVLGCLRAPSGRKLEHVGSRTPRQQGSC